MTDERDEYFQDRRTSKRLVAVGTFVRITECLKEKTRLITCIDEKGEEELLAL